MAEYLLKYEVYFCGEHYPSLYLSPRHRYHLPPLLHIRRSLLRIGLLRIAAWLLLCKHIPDRHEHLVRYAGRYSNRARGERAKALNAHQPAKTPPAAEAAVCEFAAAHT